MAITEIKYGSVASSEELNNNFNALNKDIQALSTSIDVTNANIASNISTLNKNIAEQISALNSSVDELGKSVDEKVAGVNNNVNNSVSSSNIWNKIAPNYSAAQGISMPYYVTRNGYVYAGVDGIDAIRFVKVNGKPVVSESGYSGGKTVYGGGMFPVSVGDTVTCDRALSGYYFYPAKGA